MRGQNRDVFIIFIFLVIVAVFLYFDRFVDRGRRIVSQPREIVPRGDLADYAYLNLGPGHANVHII